MTALISSKLLQSPLEKNFSNKTNSNDCLDTASKKQWLSRLSGRREFGSILHQLI